MGIFHNGIFLCRFESKGQLMKIVCQDKNDKNKGRNQDEIDQFGQVFFFLSCQFHHGDKRDRRNKTLRDIIHVP